METLVDSPGHDDPRQALAAAAEMRREAERLQDAAVRRARVAGHTGSEIADCLGVTKQAAHRKYRGRSPRPE